MNRAHELNLASWEQMAAAHGQDSYYDTEALIAGASSLTDEEERALSSVFGDRVAGREILHVQCHIGFDSITFSRRGAEVTGVDFSPIALEKAASLACRCGVDVEWVRADACELPKSLHGRFELAWATIGILCWIADLPAWMRSVAATLVDGGQLVLIDAHPLIKAASCPEPLGLWAPYGGGDPIAIDRGGDYATATRTGPQVQFQYSLGEIVTAAADAGLTLTELIEHLDSSFDICTGPVSQEPDGRWRLRVDGQQLPVMYTLRAVLDRASA